MILKNLPLEDKIAAVLAAAEKFIDDPTGQTYIDLSIPRPGVLRIKLVQLIDGGYHGVRKSHTDQLFDFLDGVQDRDACLLNMLEELKATMK